MTLEVETLDLLNTSDDKTTSIAAEHFNSVLKMADAYLTARQNNGILYDTDSIQYATEVVDMVCGAALGGLDEVVVEDYKIEFLKDCV